MATQDREVLPFIQELKQILEILHNPEKKGNIIGLITDVSGAQKMGEHEEYDFQTKIKVIDQSFNFDTELPSAATKKYLHVSIFTKTIEEAPKVENIGDILYLKRFQIGGQELLSARYQGHYSHWRLYSSQDSKGTQAYQSNVRDESDTEKYNDMITLKVKDLRAYSKQYFSQRSLLTMDWYGLKNAQLYYEGNDFDMLLKFQESHDIKEHKDIKTHVFVDGKQTHFYLQYTNLDLKKGALVKVRSIQKIEPNNVLILQKRSSITRISSHFQDYKNFDEIDNRYFYNTKLISEQCKNLSLIYTSDKNQYDNKQKHLSFIKKHYREDKELKNATALNELLQAEQEVAKTQSANLCRRHRVLCQVFDVIPDDLENAVKYYDIKTNSIKDLKDVKKGEKLQKIWQIQLGVRDQSLKGDKFLELHIFTFDNNPSNIIPDLDIADLDVTKADSKNKYKQFVKALIDQSQKNNWCEFIVEPLVYSKKVIFRVVDTMFKKL